MHNHDEEKNGRYKKDPYGTSKFYKYSMWNKKKILSYYQPQEMKNTGWDKQRSRYNRINGQNKRSSTKWKIEKKKTKNKD